MLVIRREQMEAFAAARWRGFASLAAMHCRARHPEECAELDDQSLQSVVDSALRRARSHGFDQAQDLIRYLDMYFIMGPGADQEPWVAAILSQSKYSPSTRMDLLFRTAEAQSRPAEPEVPALELRDVTWPEPKPQPVPPPPAPVFGDPSSVQRPPWEIAGDELSG